MIGFILRQTANIRFKWIGNEKKNCLKIILVDELILRFSAGRWFSGVFFLGVVVAFEVRERNP